jgi:predicted amidohydrolase
LVETQTTAAQRQGAQLICFPECFLQGYDQRREHVSATAIDLASSEFGRILHRLEPFDPVIVVGLIERRGNAFYNSAVAIERGEVVACYRKRHLLRDERPVFEPGHCTPVFDVCGTTVAINICYDLNFAESVEAAARGGARLLACPCNNMLPRAMAEQWKWRHNEIRSERAREARVWLLSSDVAGERNDRISYGPTAVIDPNGALIDQVPLMTTGMIVAEIDCGFRGGAGP